MADGVVAILYFSGLSGELGPSLWITALNVKYRDFRYVIPFIVQFGLYISPVGFSSSCRARAVATALFDQSDGWSDRWISLVHLGWPEPALFARLGVELLCSGFFLWLGISQFRKMEKSFADLI